MVQINLSPMHQKGYKGVQHIERKAICMNDFMKGRNGADELTIVMGFAGIVIAMIGSIARIQWLSWIAIAVIVIGVLRGLSKNIDARRKENEAFVATTANVPGLGKFVASLGGGAAAATRHRRWQGPTYG